jgi:ABC-2 type transport system ATP-binding protein
MEILSMQEAPMNSLEIRGLCKSYEMFSIDDLNFDVPSGCITGFIGPNGAGKTSTIRMILNMALSDSGSVQFLGQEKTVEHNTEIGVVMDTPFYNDSWTAHDIRKGLKPFYPHWDTSVFLNHLEQFKIDPKRR